MSCVKCEFEGGLLSPFLFFFFFFQADDSMRRATVVRPPCSRRGGRACQTQSGDREGFDASHLPAPPFPLPFFRPHSFYSHPLKSPSILSHNTTRRKRRRISSPAELFQGVYHIHWTSWIFFPVCNRVGSPAL